MQKSIVVILPSFLGDYEGAASDRNNKFLRAVNSFIDQSYENKILIIVSDGCSITYELFKSFYKNKHSNIYCIQIPKQELFSGKVRQAGIDFAKRKISPDYITYLDSDDYILKNHLERIVEEFKDYDWIYYGDNLNWGGRLEQRNPILEKNHIGTSNISHKAKKEFNWKNCDGYGHDWELISTKLMKNSNYSKVNISSYIVCHNPVLFDN